ncbi:CMD domain protein [Corynebacterium occultum]|uniref:CMD domain protein n=1 Tax=Corynebacterium occultum TaxID=2675219 RepID=UPI0012E1DBCB|nr:CMD domain protein [Corynebacterium occultum]
MADIINLLSALPPGSDLAALRNRRPEAQVNAQCSFESLLEPVNPGTFSFGERYAVATYVAGVHRSANAGTFYAELLLDDAPATLRDAVLAAVEQGLSSGPHGDGGVIRHDPRALGHRLASALDVAHLMVFHPRDARPEMLGHLSAAGWSADDTVSLTQLVAFLSFQLRLIHGMQVLNDQAKISEVEQAAGVAAQWELAARSFEITTYPDVVGPAGFVSHPLEWKPWVPPMAGEELETPYFRLLARNPAALKAHTLIELDIFHTLDGGIGRAERELAAAVTSRLNGCVYCTSVHAGRVKEEVGRARDLERLLAEGVAADLGDQLWNAVAEAAVALSHVPMRFGTVQVENLRKAGLDELAIIDVVNAVAFANWANRLRLVLGEPEVPQRFR